MTSSQPDDDEFADIEFAELDEGVALTNFDTDVAATEHSRHPGGAGDPGTDDQARAGEASAATDSADAVDAANAVDGPADDELARTHAAADRLREHVADLDALDSTELVDHVEFYQRAHTELQRALSDIDNS